MKTRNLILSVLFIGLFGSAQAQTYYARRIVPRAALPAYCNPANGEVTYLTAGLIGLYECTAASTWQIVGFGRTGANTQLVAPVGSVGVPSLTFLGDLTTGIYRPAASQVAIAGGGVQLFNFATGNIYFGAASRIRSIADGQVNLANNAYTDFLSLTLGPETVAFPRLGVSPAVGGQTQGIVILKGDGSAAAFADLGAAANGAMIYCSDCTIASPCAGAGNGAIAKRLNGAWVCN